MDDYFIEPRVYGQPVYVIYDMFKPGYASARAGDVKANAVSDDAGD